VFPALRGIDSLTDVVVQLPCNALPLDLLADNQPSCSNPSRRERC
jgi:hypothetical protein